MRLVILSPHLDDAVFSCGQLLAGNPGSLMLTVMAGLPDEGVTTPYDAGAEAGSSREVVLRRRGEDATAAALLGCDTEWLSFLDSQYGQPVRAQSIFEELERRVFDGDMLVAPIGLRHPDHIVCAEAAVSWARRTGAVVWFYEELPYRVLEPELVQPALDKIARDVFALLDLEWPGPCGSLDAKQRAIARYASQLRAPAPHFMAALDAPERYWRADP